jgi:hypothetical protein
MAVQIKAKGDAPNTGMPKQPRPEAPDEATWVRHPSKAGYGMNGDPSGSSAPIGKVISPLGANIRATVDDPALEALIADGMGRKTTIDSAQKLTGQERPISSDPIKPAHGMRNRSGE